MPLSRGVAHIRMLLVILLQKCTAYIQVVAVVEAVASSCPPGPQLLQLLLDQRRRYPTDWRWAEWLVPLCAAAACGGSPGGSHASPPPSPAPAAWRALVDLTGRVSAAAARGLAERALQAQPWDAGLWRVRAALAGGAQAAAR
jgi:hypothetical protein